MVVELKVRDHAAAVMDQLADYAATVPSVALRFYLGGAVPANPSYPYVAVWISQRFDSSLRRVSDDSVTQAFRVTTQYVASSPNSAWGIQEHVYAALNGYRLVVDDVECSPMHQEPGAPVAQDPDLEYLYVGADSWTFVSTPQL